MSILAKEAIWKAVKETEETVRLPNEDNVKESGFKEY
jgi:hypothetical protein